MIERLQSIPPKPGVYLFKDAKEKILYVGKAKNLRNRLRSYFQKSAELDARKSSMVKNIKDFSYVVTGNELEALVLEANLIKQHKPKFNIILRDDKSYPYLKLTLNEEWPRLEVVRKIKKDKALYFGPYVPAGSMWEALSFIRKIFLVRPCRYPLDKPMRPCIQHQMGKCLAPCAGLVSKSDYLRIANDVRLFLQGRKKELLQVLEKRMAQYSEDLKFEDAAKMRDSISNLKRIWESQRVISPELGDIDVIGFHMDAGAVALQVLFVRNGIMIGAKDFLLKDTGDISTKELIHSFMELFYAKDIIPPGEIVSSVRPDNAATLTKWLEGKKGAKVLITVPKKGKKLELLKMAVENAEISFKNKKQQGIEDILNSLRERLSLTLIPHSIGAFDISTISGSESVGAFIFWTDDNFRKDLYRHMKIKTVKGVDDYSMMKEVIVRTLKNIGDKMPSLLLIDGGRGQLEAARTAAKEINIKTDIISVAKKPDRAFTLKSDAAIDLEDRSASSLLLKKIRDEAHRFAITFHRKLRDKRLMESPLEKIHGIGKKRRLTLLKHFGSIDMIRKAGIDDISAIKGFNKKIAEKLLEELRRKSD